MRCPEFRRAALLAVAAAAAALATVASAADPGPPGLPFLAYGQVQADGANISPVAQPILAFVRGVACGAGTTKVATAGQNTPPEEVGKTVYVIDVLADGGDVSGSKAGCGRPGDPVTFYFPQSHRVATQHPAWQSEARRENLDLGIRLTNRLLVVGASRAGN